MNTDSHFCIGSTHRVCEDYAAAGHHVVSEQDVYYAIVSDGCSSSPNTDFGSRIITAYAVRKLKTFDPQSFGIRFIMDCKDIADELNLHPMALDATLNIAWACENTLKIVCFGDGAAIIVYEDGEKDIFEFQYPSGAPLYLNYYLSHDRYNNYIKEFGLKRRLIINGKEIEFIDTENPFVFEKKLDKIKAVFVTSDGIGSFQKRNDTKIITSSRTVNVRDVEPIEVADVVDKLLDIKGYQGEFLKRRYNGFKRMCLKENWEHKDDMSIAGIYFN